MVKRGNLKRSKLAANQSMNENSFMNSVLGDGMVDQKDGSTTHIQSTAQAQGEISLRKYILPKFGSNVWLLLKHNILNWHIPFNATHAKKF